MRVLILGGYGAFGARLARLLADEAGVDLIIAGRSLARAQALAALVGGTAAVIDRNGNVEAALRPFAPDVVVDASGPFQTYGPDPYRVIQASFAVGADYLDLADATGFVAGVDALDGQAKAAGRLALSGLSTLPALSFAAARALAADMDSLNALEIGIAPSPKAPLGLSVVAATTSYAGAPVQRLQDSQAIDAVGLVEARRWTIAPAGGLPMRRRLFLLADTPDLRLAPLAWPGLKTIWTGAGPAPQAPLRLLRLLAWLRSRYLAPSLTPFAGLFHRVINGLRWGEDRGGMMVEARGVQGGRPVTRSWMLTAEGDDGPFIPAMAAAAVIRRMLAGGHPTAGARPATQELDLDDFHPLFAARRITTGVWEELAADAPLFQRVLGEAFHRLPAQVQALHAGQGDEVWAGRASVERGQGPLVSLICAVVGLPAATGETPVRVDIQRRAGREVWRRTFGGQSFSSQLSLGRGRRARLILERFGPLTIAMALVAGENRLDFVIRGWSLLGLPLPAALAPRSTTFEAAPDGRFAFDVEIALPLVGRIVRYRGALTRTEPVG
ncbi:MAG TPA: DUF4166 domain-containing protein [Caulobacteraceae bacterium]